MNKTAIKNFSVWAREKLISDIIYKASMIGITEDGIADELPQSTNDLHFLILERRIMLRFLAKKLNNVMH